LQRCSEPAGKQLHIGANAHITKAESFKDKPRRPKQTKLTPNIVEFILFYGFLLGNCNNTIFWRMEVCL